MFPNVYCPFCGIVLLPDPSIDGATSPDTRLRPWYSEVRGIYSSNGHVTITGLGIVWWRNRLRAPLDDRLSYVDLGVDSLEEWGICDPSTLGHDPSERPWCFGVHNSCWKLLLLRLGDEQDAVIDSVFYQLYCTPCFEGSVFQFGHDYDGADATHKPSGLPKPVDLNSPFYCDPLKVPPLEEVEATVPDLGWTGHRGPDRIGHRAEGLHRLLPELKLEILSYLSFHEVLNLRLICRSFALAMPVNDLPQSYWRSRFLRGQEADFLFPPLIERPNWARLFFGVRASMRSGLLPLVNRMRIRRLLEPIAVLVELGPMLHSGPHGCPIPVMEIGGDGGQEIPRIATSDVSFSGQLSSIDADKPLHEGCRVLHYRSQSLIPPSQQEPQRIGISTIQIGERTFISGINLFPTEACESRLVGYRIPAHEQWIEIPPTLQVEAFCAALCSEGLTGIKLIFTDSTSSGWIGNGKGQGVALGTLPISPVLQQPYLLAGLDRFKIVSLGLGKLTGDPGSSLNASSQTARDPSCALSRLWMPHPPVNKGLMLTDLLPCRRYRAFEPLTNIDFGGPKGLRLGTLIRLVVYMVKGTCPLIGMEAFYSNGTSTLFGSNLGCGLSLFLSGPKGERINRIGILQGYASRRPLVNFNGFVPPNPQPGLGGLQISTNFGQVATFARLRDRTGSPVQDIPVLPPSNSITGLAASLSCNNSWRASQRQTNSTASDQNPFVRLCVQSQECVDRPMIPENLDREYLQTPDVEIQFDDRFSHFMETLMWSYQTYASLDNVWNIQASTGIRGRSRADNCISGLKFEYYDHRNPSTVGQWMNDLDDRFELSPNEEIQSLTVWLTPVGLSSRRSGKEIGQVAAVYIETTCLRSVMFRAPEFHALAPRKLRHQYQRHSDERFTAISWALNEQCDIVRAVRSVNDSQAGDSLTLVPGCYPPFDQVQKFFFDSYDGNDSGGDTICTAEAYFADFSGPQIVGIVFTYTSGRTASMGDLETDIRQTIHFTRDVRRIVGLSVAGDRDKLLALDFEVELIDGPARYSIFSLSTDSTRDPADAAWDGYRNTWCKDELSADNCEVRRLNDHVYKPPSKSKMVGMYIGCTDLYHVGALYKLQVL
ncbi:hypothetical protein BJX99DRAFT_265147 [Aspergillus californicus]